MEDNEFNDNQQEEFSTDFFDLRHSELQKGAERGLIGQLGIHQGSKPIPQEINALNIIRPEFFTGWHQPLIKIYLNYYRETGLIASLTTIIKKTKKNPDFKGIQVEAEIGEMMHDATPSIEIEADILQDLYIKRERKKATGLLINRLEDAITNDESMKAFNDFDRKIRELEDLKMDKVESLRDVYKNHLSDIENGNIVDPIPTGFEELDAKLNGGLAPATLTVIGARPAVGKSAIMTQIAYQMAREKKPVLIFTMEMPSQQVETRIANQQIDPDNLPEGVTMEMVKNPTNKALSFLNDVMSVPIYISEERQTIDQIEQITAKYRRTKGIRAVFIDYAGLIRLTPDDLKVAQCERLDDWGGRLKELAKRYEIPVIILSQLNREAADGRRPSLVNLRGSDGIGNASDVIIFLHRPENGDKRNIEIILDKNRDGETGIFNAEFTPDRVRFDNLTPKEWKEKRDKIRQNEKNTWKSAPLAKKTKQKNYDLELEDFVERKL